MNREKKENSESGISISVQIPAKEPDIYKHKATDDTLLFLSRHPFDEFTIGELAERMDHTKPTVTRAVDVLEANDLVTDNPQGHRRLVQINRERLSIPDDPYLRIPQVEFHEPVKAAVDELTEELDGLLGIILYGSVARGEADRRSDIDLWVLVSDDRPTHQRTVNEIVQELEAQPFDGSRYGYDIDVEDVSSIPRYTDDIREIVLSGITLHETPQFDTVENLLLNDGDNDE